MAYMKQNFALLKEAQPGLAGEKPSFCARKQKLILAVQHLRLAQADLSGLGFNRHIQALDSLVETMQAAIGKREADPLPGPDMPVPVPLMQQRKDAPKN